LTSSPGSRAHPARAFNLVVAGISVLCAAVAPLRAAADESPEGGGREGKAATVGKFLAGGLAGLVAHESGHLLADEAFGTDVNFKRVELGGIPFFAIAHGAGQPPREEYVISSAGFWAQHLTSEIILSARPQVRSEHAPFLKGVLAFDVLTSVGYGAVAFARAGPPERDTRAMAASLGVPEPWVGALVLAPAVLDAYRYHRPNSAWARWASRAVKIGAVLLVFAAH
jgi:hypothetical protein